ncbi:cysteine protease family C01A [Achlya hypogyna]|uniref:Cysteine protease family C01A n=1 Tax=Achlya hypogyna TaxID=1202772 RepID=A0A1V9YQW7_ACHHY|nr:cysteine protease family C01A [Achlya hypogyna]
MMKLTTLAGVAAVCQGLALVAPSVDDFDAAILRQTKMHRMDLPAVPRQSKEARQAALDLSSRIIHDHNRNPNRTYDMRYNAMSDFSDDEYHALLNTRPDFVPHELSAGHHRWSHETSVQQSAAAATGSYPAAIDWSTKDGGKYATPVKNQGICGSCWAFTAASVIESMTAIASNTQAIPLSVEQILSCSTSLQHVQSGYANKMISSAKGCNGGMTFLAFEYLKQKAPHGLTCNALSPYRMQITTDADAATSALCTDVDVVSQWSSSTSYLNIQNSQDEVIKALQNGPLSISIDASGAGFRHYGGGIYDARDCKSDGVTVDHAVMLMGYGETDDGQLYWIVRNSWGTMWGENGQMRMKRTLSPASPSGPCNAFLYATQPSGLTQVGTSQCIAAAAAVPQDAVSMSFVPPSGLFFGVASALVVLGVGSLAAGEWRLKRAFPRQTYVESFLNHQLPNRAQLVAHMAKKKIKADALV